MAKVLTTGCSNSSNIVGLSWADYLQESLPDHEYVKTYSCGAGNEFILQKVITLMKSEDFDYVIVQLSEPSRLTLAMNSITVRNEDVRYSSHAIGNVSFYTYNTVANLANLEYLTKRRYSKDVDHLMISEHIVNEYNLEQKTLSTMLALQALCDATNTKLLFWSWFVDIQAVIKKQNMERFFKDNIVPNWAENLINTHKRAPCMHLYSESHKYLLDEWLMPHFQKFGL